MKVDHQSAAARLKVGSNTRSQKVDDHCGTISDKDFFKAALILRKQRKQSQIEKCNGNQGIVVRISGTKRGDAENDPIGGLPE